MKGLLGKCGCTRMVQGGYNVALAEGDSVERHFMDTIEGGKWLPDQELAWTLVTGAVERIHELENELGCFFDRNPDGTLHQKAFAGQTFDRTVHKGDLTGIEIINRLAEQVWARGIERLEEHRAVELIPDTRRRCASPACCSSTCAPASSCSSRARAVVLATGGGPTMYQYHTPSGDKTCDGLAMALRAGLPLRDMEMVQFHPTGLLAGAAHADDRHGARGGPARRGRLPRSTARASASCGRTTRAASARRATSCRARSTPRCARAAPRRTAASTSRWATSAPSSVRREFKGMVERCADCGFDLAGGRVEVVPTAHYMMGGVEFDVDCTHRTRRALRGGRGHRRRARREPPRRQRRGQLDGVRRHRRRRRWRPGSPKRASLRAPDASGGRRRNRVARRRFRRTGGDLHAFREALLRPDVGRRRDPPRRVAAAPRAATRSPSCRTSSIAPGFAGGTRAFNLTWHDWLNLDSLLTVSSAIAHAALAREDSCGAHYREDFPQTGDPERPAFTRTRFARGGFSVEFAPVEFTRVRPGESVR